MQQNQSHRYSAKYGYIIACVLWLWMGFSVQSLYAAPSEQHCQYDIQRYSIAKNQTIQGKDQPDPTTWQSFDSLPHYWNELWSPFEPSAWYKIEWNYHCPTPSTAPSGLVFANLNLAARIYLNDALIWQSIQLQEPYSRHLHRPLYLPLTASNLQPGANTLLLHVYGTATQQAGLGQLYLAEQVSASHLYEKLFFEKRSLNFFNFSIYLVLMMFCLLVWLFSRQYWLFLWFAISSGLWATYVGLSTWDQPAIFLSNLLLDKLCIIVFCWFTFAATISIWRFADKRFPRIERALLTVFSIATLCILCLPDQYQPLLQKYVFISAVMIYVIKAVTYPVVIYKSQHKEVYFMLLNQYIYVVTGIHDAHYMLTQQGNAWSPYTLPLGSLFLAVILALRISRDHQQIRSFNKVLQQSVHSAKQELGQSLSKQHELNVQNAKLQERIALAHDLHDGLGSSIVRALMMTEHQQLDQQKMRSILKLLRNDLRQVIDSGSVAGAQIPDTPILWVANLRRRFSEILEDLNIETQWQIPQQWQNTPSPLVCLTLSRILEEALTNVLKHSQASAVLVHLQQTDTALILTIRDNGQGFDVQSVADGMHVGLTSMRSRAIRLGGRLDIESSAEHTQIQVTLPLQIIQENMSSS